MAIKSISTLMGDLKESYDKSKDRSSWKVLQGMNREYYDTFVAGDNKIVANKIRRSRDGRDGSCGQEIITPG
jgi:hypothetical protein